MHASDHTDARHTHWASGINGPPRQAKSVKDMDKMRFNRLIDDAICKQVWTGNAQRTMHMLECRIEASGDSGLEPRLAKAREDFNAAKWQSSEAIRRLTEYLQ